MISLANHEAVPKSACDELRKIHSLFNRCNSTFKQPVHKQDLDTWLGMAIVVEVSVLPQMELSQKERRNLEANLKNNKDRLAKRLYNGKAILLKGRDKSNYHPQHSGG